MPVASEDLEASTDIQSDKSLKATQILNEVKSITNRYISDNYDDDFLDYVNISSEIINNGTTLHIIISAEMDYNELEDFVEPLNATIEQYDDGAYFDFVAPGIIECFISLSEARDYNITDTTSDLEEVTSAYDPEPRLEPDEDDSWEELEEAGDVLYITFNDVPIEVKDEDWWEYENTDWAKEDGRYNKWWSESVQASVYPEDDVIEAVDALIAPYIPAKTGRYVINGSAELMFVLDNVYHKISDYHWDERHGAEYDEEIDASDADIEFDDYNSKINVTVTPIA